MATVTDASPSPATGGLRLLITGASGNIGTALLRRLAADPRVSEVHGVCRRLPDPAAPPYAAATWHSFDLAQPAVVPALAERMRGLDAVVHLAWQIQPSHDEPAMRRTNVDGTGHVVAAAAAAGVPHLVCASSVGADAPGPKAEAVDAAWPVTGVPTSAYSRHKAAVEALLDDAVADHPRLAVARFRPGLVMQRDAGSEIGRYFLGELLPHAWMGRLPLPLVPLPSLRAQVVHADDVAAAVVEILHRRATGAFNVAADPPITAVDIARALHAARYLPVPWALARATAALTWRIRLQPTSEGWIDLGRQVPVMSTARAKAELGWRPRVPAPEAITELVRGIGDGAGAPSPAMAPRRASGDAAGHAPEAT
jgi:nucleoside-diphosphate-sugar epimerase